MPTLTYREAAKRVRRSTITIKRRNVLPMTWELRSGQRCRVVEERTLLAWWRDRLKADPVHQARLARFSGVSSRPDDREEIPPDP